ncbi:MAG: condensation domain-containing protein, partial [bacterium]
NIPLFFQIKNDVDIHVLERSLQAIVHRHEVLRSFIATDSKGNGYQQVNDTPLSITWENKENIKQIYWALGQDANHIFNLSGEYPIRIKLYEAPQQTRYLSIVIHHIAFDGWSVNILAREIASYYHHYSPKDKTDILPLAGPALQYKDFAVWQKSYLNPERLQREVSYWKEKLSGFETLQLTTDKPRPPELSYQGDYLRFDLDEETSRRLRHTAKELKVSLYSLLLSGCYLMLKAYSNQQDITIGTPIANRNYPQTEDLIGFFVNSLALRASIDGNQTATSFIRTIGEEVVQAQLHQDLPFEKLVQELQVPVDPSRHPIFQVVFATEQISEHETKSLELLEPEELPQAAYQVAKFDLTII